MHKTLIIEAASKTSDMLSWLQLASAVIVGIAAIAVPAYFVIRDRTSKKLEAQRRARSFALAHFHELEMLRDYLSMNAKWNLAGEPVADHSMIEAGLRGARDCKIPLIDLHLLDDGADDVQHAFAAIARAQSYQLRRNTLAQQGNDIAALDMRQAEWLREAYESLQRGLSMMETLLK